MTDNDKAAPDRRNMRSQRKAPEIEMKAAEATLTPVETPVDVSAGKATETAVPTQETTSQTMAEAEATAPDIIAPPVAPPAQKSVAGPMAIAAVIGGLLGTAGGAIVPGLLSPNATVGQADIQKLKQTVSALEARPAAPAGNVTEVQTLQQRLAAVEGDLAKRVADAEKRLADRLSKVETTLSNPDTKGSAGAAPLDITPLTTRLSALEQGLKAADGKADATAKASEPRISALAERVEQATKRMEAGSAAPLFTAVQGLAQAFHRGGSYTTELSAVELMGAKPDQLAPLKAFAEKGAPTLQQIGAGFAAFAGPLAQSGESAPSGAMAYLQRFVKMRPVGEVGGNTPPDIVKTIEAAVAKGNISEALAAWGKLPEAARAPSAAWAKMADDRDKAAKTLTTLQDSAIAALRTAKP